MPYYRDNRINDLRLTFLLDIDDTLFTTQGHSYLSESALRYCQGETSIDTQLGKSRFTVKPFMSLEWKTLFERIVTLNNAYKTTSRKKKFSAIHVPSHDEDISDFAPEGKKIFSKLHSQLDKPISRSKETHEFYKIFEGKREEKDSDLAKRLEQWVRLYYVTSQRRNLSRELRSTVISYGH